MLKRILILMAVTLFSSSLIYGANCYSSASIENIVSIGIVDSEDALIAIPSSLTLKDNTIVTHIKNNTNEKIWVTVNKGNIVCRGIIADSDFGVAVESKEKISVTINFDSGDIVSEVTFHARWHGNNRRAEIRSFIQ